MKILTLSKPIALSLTRAHLDPSDPAYQFSIKTAILYVEDTIKIRFLESQNTIKPETINIIVTSYVPHDSSNGTPYQLSALGGNQEITIRVKLIDCIAPAT